MNKSIASKADYLVNTSVEDMRSTLQCALANRTPISQLVLIEALNLVKRRGEKTKANILKSYLRKALVKE